MASRRLLLVHAHPDDECLGTGGTIARYASEGAHVCLVTCTNGELGEVAEHPEFGDVEQIKARLGDVRVEELREACRRLGTVDLRLLGYHDSGMNGTPGNEDPVAFVNQHFAGVVAKLVAIVREVRPQVVVTYNEFGFYGHPDHIRAHEATLAAIDAAADPRSPHPGGVHRVDKLYYTAMPRSFLRMAREMTRELGFDHDAFVSEEDIAVIGTDDEKVTTAIDVTAFVDRKFAALEAHRTQLGTTRALLDIPEAFRELALGAEHYVLARTDGPRPEGIETDLFQGVA